MDLSLLSNYKNVINRASAIEINLKEPDISKDLIMEHNTDLTVFVSNLKEKYKNNIECKKYMNFSNENKKLYVDHEERKNKINLILLILLILFGGLFLVSTSMTIYTINNKTVCPVCPELPEPKDITELLPGAYLGKFDDKIKARSRMDSIIRKTKYIVDVDDSVEGKFVITGNEKAGFFGKSVYTWELK
ncbi:hypothetical protein [Spiroplasma sp. BIUS-1]|uniref:hypothetical protein n=1 Tax=Spiroplasma sp. BIUS-1 TaxID=216964 RepID=UPI0013A6C4AD|nr:hypothetical protein [Spiroplasma sp. BIUS-1]